jgi:DNA polymerase-3 subunit alpha
MAANMHNEYADRKNGRKPVTYYHDDLREILEPTFGLCLTGDTVVYDATSGLPRRLDEIDPDAGFSVQGVDADLRPAVRQVTHWVCNGERDTVRLQLSNGMSLAGTPDHRVLTDRGWMGIGALRDDDYVAVPHHLVSPVRADRCDPYRLRVLGYLIADGGVSQGAKANFFNSEDELISAYRHALTEAFPTVHHGVTHSPNGVKVVYTGNGRGNGGPASPLINWLRELGLKAPKGSKVGGPKSGEKFVPDFVFGLDDDDVGRLLAALWDCDGYICERFTHYKTVSSILARQVQDLLLRLGMSSVIYEAELDRDRNPDGSERSYQVTVFEGSAFTDRVQRYMASSRKWQVPFAAESKGTTVDRATFVKALRARINVPTRELAERYDLPRWNVMPYAVAKRPRIHAGTMTNFLEHVEMPQIERLLNVQWVRVRSVQEAGRKPVYDITVDGIHNFVANGLVAHNCIYQEELMRMAEVLAGYSLEEADNLRKATGKKIRSLIAKERSKFVEGCVAQGHTRDFGEEMFNIIEPFADYSFNKSHSVGYGYVAYQTAYLKANYPVEYLAALLTSVKSNKDQTAVYLNECRQVGIPVLVPDVNESESDFAVRDGSIRFGLSAVRNVGEGLVQHIVAARDEGGPFADFFDYCERVDPQALNKRTIESLVKAGAFDSLGHPRKGLLHVYEQIVDHTLARRRERDAGIMSLFGGDGGAVDGGAAGDGFDERVTIPETEFDKRARLAHEKEMLGLYVSEHPLMGAERGLRRHVECTLTELKELREGELRVVGGVVTALSRRYTKRGDLMATFVLEDLGSALEVMVFPKTMTSYGHVLEEDAIVCVKGRLDLRDDDPKIIAMEITQPELVLDGGPPVRIRVKRAALNNVKVEGLKEILRVHPGDSPVYVHLEGADRTTVLQLADEYLVDSSNGLYADLRVLLGADCIA